jgi:uncharacterized integral membrane protein
VSKIKTIVIAAAAVLGLIIILQNTESVQTNILFMKIIMPRAILLLITLVLGGVIGALSAYWVLRKKERLDK